MKKLTKKSSNTLTKKEFIADLQQLVSFQTLTGNIEENKKALDVIESKISSGAIIKRLQNGKAECLIASTMDTRTPDFCFLVHVDVVAGKPEQFTMTTKNGVAYGRGVSDMKFSIPIGYALLNELVAVESKISYAFVVTTDEETGGFEGAAYLTQEYGFKPKTIIVPDGGDNFTFVDKAKGVCALRIESVGLPAHSSRIWDGKNALEPIIKLCSAVLARYEQNNKSESWKTTVNIGKLQGGVSANQVCPEAYVILDFRFPETTTFQNIFDEVQELALSIDSSLKISTHSIGKPTSVDVHTPIVKTFLSTCEKVIGRKIEVKGTYGASDARHFAEPGVPILMIKPNGGDIHGDNEHIDIDSCLLFYTAVRDFLLHW